MRKKRRGEMIITPLIGLCYVGLVGAGGCSCAYAHGTLIAWIIGRASRMRPLLLSETTPLLQIAHPAFQLAIAARACVCRGLGLVRGAVQLHAEAVQLYSHSSRPRFMQIVEEARQNATIYQLVYSHVFRKTIHVSMKPCAIRRNTKNLFTIELEHTTADLKPLHNCGTVAPSQAPDARRDRPRAHGAPRAHSRELSASGPIARAP